MERFLNTQKSEEKFQSMSRYIELQGVRPNHESIYPDNTVLSSKYTIYTFLPKELISQFKEPEKIWFLLISVMELSRLNVDITISIGTILPLLLLVTLELIKEAWNDYLRHKSDDEINYQQYPIWDGHNFSIKKSKDILVGDIILMYDNEYPPADILILASGNIDHEVYVETTALFGESTLNVKYCVKDLLLIFDSMNIEEATAKLKDLNEELHVSDPNSDLNNFYGKIKLRIYPRSSKIGIDNLILKGMKISNTPWIFGAVLYAGTETKIWMSNQKIFNKCSRLEKISKTWIRWLLMVVIIVCAFNTIIYSTSNYNLPYSWSEILASNIILFGHILPISLLLCVEFKRIFMNIIMLKMKNIVLNSNKLFGNLGMVEYIVTDKTGTLTENNLKICFCSVLDMVFWDRESYYRTGREEFDNVVDESAFLKKLYAEIKMEDNENLLTLDDLSVNFSSKPEDEIYINYFLCMAICNLAFPNGSEYMALSVDDKELARMASRLGVTLIERDTEVCELDILGKEVVFIILGYLQSSSNSKKSRIVVKNCDDDKIYMYVKGTRQSLLELYEEDHHHDEVLDGYRTVFMGYKEMKKTESKRFSLEYTTAKTSPLNKEDRIEAVFEKYEKNLVYLGFVGLEDPVSDKTRSTVKLLKQAGIKFWVVSGDSEESTLTAAHAADIFLANDKLLTLNKLNSDIDFLNTVQDYIQQGIYIDDPNTKKKKSLINEDESDEVFESFPQVVETKRSEIFKKTSIKKIKNIDTNKSFDSLFKNLQSIKSLDGGFRKFTSNPALSELVINRKKTNLKKKFMPDKINFVLSVDDSGLDYALKSKANSRYFVTLAFAAKAVCFHSLNPKSKRKVVKMLKNNFSFKPLVLAIGDGISDIGMFEESDISIGIVGKEGKDAGNKSDICIKHFSQLKTLLLIDGYANYILVSKMMLLSLYAMAFIETELFLYNCLADFSAFSMVQKEFVVIKRLFLSVIPLLGMCLLDRDKLSTILNPLSYNLGIYNMILSKSNLLIFCSIGILQATSAFIFTYLLFKFSISEKGYTENSLVIGSTLSFIIDSSILLTSFLETYSITFNTLILYLFTSMSLLSICLPLSYIHGDLLGYLSILGDYYIIWFHILMAILVNVTISYAFRSIKFLIFPSLLEKIRTSTKAISNQTRIQKYRKNIKNVFREDLLETNNIIHDSEKINFKILKFHSHYRETLYQEDKLAGNFKSFQNFLLIGGLSILIYCIYMISYNYGNVSLILFLILYTIAMNSAFIYPKIQKIKKYFGLFISILFLLNQLLFFISTIGFNLNSIDMYCYSPVLYVIGFSNVWLETTITIVLSVALVFVSSFFYDTSLSSLENIELLIGFMVLYISICVTVSFAAYFIDKSSRQEFNLVQKVQIEIQKTKDVLSHLLPEFVRKRVKDGVRYISEDQGVASIIFCDIYNFEDLLRLYTPQELTSFLDEVFAKIDQKCSSSGCTKIETVGKTYMACAGFKESKIENDPVFACVSHARRVVELGISVINLCESTFLKNGENLKVKIGISSGPVTAGVVGYHKPQFSLVGDTVNTASRMASLCPQANTIQISLETFELMLDFSGLSFKPFEVIAKGKGKMKTFLVSINVKEIGSNTLNSPIENLFRNKKISKKMTLYQFETHAVQHRKRASILENLNKVVLEESEDFKRNETEQLDKIKLFSLGCQESKKETEFRILSSETNLIVTKNSLVIRILCDLVFLVLAIVASSVESTTKIYTILRLVIELTVFSVLFYKFDKEYKKISFCWYLGLSYIIGATLRLIDYENIYIIIFTDYLLYITQASLCSQLLFNKLSLSILYVSVFQIIMCLSYGYNSRYIITSILFLITLIFTMYSREERLRSYYIIKSSAEKELAKTDELISKMMPKNVLEKLKEQNHVTEYINGVSILYADIAGFTQWSSNKLSNEVVGMLSNLFTEFDHKCTEFDVYKVHTIGDCYVALGYTGAKVRNEATECYNLARFALALVKSIEDVNTKNKISLGMRIGLHTGDIIGGIAGTNIVRYDIYGTDVLIANKMESSGKIGKVHISQSTKNLLETFYPSEFIFIEGEEVEAPITGLKISTYFIEEKL